MAAAWQIATVLLVLAAYYAAVFAAVQLWLKERLQRDRLLVPYLSLCWTAAVLAATATLSARNSDPSEGLFTTRRWYSAGWDTGLSVFSLRVDAWWKYLLVLLYQATRAIMGSLINNFFYSYLTVEVQAHGARRTHRDRRAIMGAQAAANVFSYFASLTDVFIAMAQIDLSVLMLVTTMAADAVSTSYFVHADNDAIKLREPKSSMEL